MTDDSLILLNTRINKHDPVKASLAQGKIAVIIPAAGESRRMKGVNKLFLDVAGRPVLLRTVEVFLSLGEHIPVIVAISSHDLSRAHQLFKGMPNVSVVLGGDCRQESVAHALTLVGDEIDYVLVHDGARPLLKRGDLEAFVTKGLQLDALVMAVPVKDTVKKINSHGLITETPRREELWLAQTPQMFKRSLLCTVHAEACSQGFVGTDEAALLERRGYAVAVFPGSYENIKITTPEDIGYARSVLTSRGQEQLADGQDQAMAFPGQATAEPGQPQKHMEQPQEHTEQGPVDPDQARPGLFKTPRLPNQAQFTSSEAQIEPNPAQRNSDQSQLPRSQPAHPAAVLTSDSVQRKAEADQQSEEEYPRALPAMVEMNDLAPRVRIGFGYDMHSLAEGRELILGGVRIHHERGLLGHSDADVLTHSIMDAMLGALALGDIGKAFPDSDRQYKDIGSLILLKKVAAMVKIHGYTVGNIDTVICAQKPRLTSYIGHIRESLAACLDLTVGQVSVKATTTEGLGPEGREEGISAQAVVILEKVMT